MQPEGIEWTFGERIRSDGMGSNCGVISAGYGVAAATLVLDAERQLLFADLTGVSNVLSVIDLGDWRLLGHRDA